jgi:integrase/recombinase XerD
MTKHARTINEEEFNTLLHYVAGMRYAERNRLLLFLTHKAGMRVGEVSALKHYDMLIPVDVCMNDNGRAVSDLSVYIQNIQYIVSPIIQLRKREVKGKHARTVHLSETVQREIQQYYTSVHKLSYERLCINARGNCMNNVALAQEMRRWYLECSMLGCSSHTGRRGFVTELLDKQVNIKVVQELVGHRHLSTTQCYADTRSSALKAAVNLL